MTRGTFGISRVLDDYDDYRVETSKTRGLFNKGGDQPLLLDENPVAIVRTKIARETQATLNSAKAAIEAAQRTGPG
jgi:hypothetical protein